jgi:hypothetical protein
MVLLTICGVSRVIRPGLRLVAAPGQGQLKDLDEFCQRVVASDPNLLCR